MKKLILYISLIGSVSLAQAQVRAIEQADELYNGREFLAAAKYYERIVAQNRKKDNEWIFKIAECYRMLKDYPKAAEYYAQLTDQKNAPLETYLNYGHTLRYLNRQNEAKEMYEKYRSLGGKIDVQAYIDGCTFAGRKDILNDKYSVKATNVVTDGLYLGGGWYDNGLVYAASHKVTDEKTKLTYPHYSLVYSAYQNGRFEDGKEFAPSISTKFYIGSATLTKDGNTMYFTKNDSETKISKKKKFAKDGLSQKGVNTLNIYMTKKEGNGWSNPVSLEFNSRDYNTTNPSLSPDGTKMVFASDKPGGVGGYDLYIVENHGGGWSNPQHMESVVNSPDDEMFPYLADDSTLYFSSNGFVGLGGADIFVSHLHQGHWSAPENMGKGINSVKDDFGLFFYDARKGFFASNRNTEPGRDEIFSIERLIPYKKGEGQVIDKLYLSRLEGVEVELYEGKTFLTTLYTDRKGDYEYANFDPEKKYSLLVKKKGYKEQEMDVDPLTADLKHLDFRLEPIIEKNTVLTFNDILFEYGKAEVKGDSRTILARVTDLLLSNPGAKIELSAHTDSRGSDKVNLTLSQKRAQACVDILVAGGVDKNNLIAKGYGESKLKNKCGNKVECTEEEHAVNRRVEIKVLDVK